MRSRNCAHATAVSAFAMEATWGRVLAAAGLALLAATLNTIVLDSFVTMNVRAQSRRRSMPE